MKILQNGLKFSAGIHFIVVTSNSPTSIITVSVCETFNIKKGSNCSLVVSITEQFYFRMPKMNVEKKEKKAEKRKKLKQHVAQKGELECETEPKKKKQDLQVGSARFDCLIQ